MARMKATVLSDSNVLPERGGFSDRQRLIIHRMLGMTRNPVQVRNPRLFYEARDAATFLVTGAHEDLSQLGEALRVIGFFREQLAACNPGVMIPDMEWPVEMTDQDRAWTAEERVRTAVEPIEDWIDEAKEFFARGGLPEPVSESEGKKRGKKISARHTTTTPLRVTRAAAKAERDAAKKAARVTRMAERDAKAAMAAPKPPRRVKRAAWAKKPRHATMANAGSNWTLEAGGHLDLFREARAAGEI